MKNSEQNNEQSSSRAKTRLEVAEEYGISRRTLRRRLKALNIQIPPGRITPADLKRIYRALGEPPFREEDEKR
jgi:transcriptional antiterminator